MILKRFWVFTRYFWLFGNTKHKMITCSIFAWKPFSYISTSDFPISCRFLLEIARFGVLLLRPKLRPKRIFSGRILRFGRSAKLPLRSYTISGLSLLPIYPGDPVLDTGSWPYKPFHKNYLLTALLHSAIRFTCHILGIIKWNSSEAYKKKSTFEDKGCARAKCDELFDANGL